MAGYGDSLNTGWSVGQAEYARSSPYRVSLLQSLQALKGNRALAYGGAGGNGLWGSAAVNAGDHWRSSGTNDALTMYTPNASVSTAFQFLNLAVAGASALSAIFKIFDGSLNLPPPGYAGSGYQNVAASAYATVPMNGSAPSQVIFNS